MSRWLLPLFALLVAAGCGDVAMDDDAANRTGEAPATVAERNGADRTAAAEETDEAAHEVVYVDVRTREEYAQGHVEGAINIPHTEMGTRHDELAEFAGEEIVVYCRSGRRSGIAKRILESEGYDNVVNGGGLRDLAAQGVPTTR